MNAKIELPELSSPVALAAAAGSQQSTLIMFAATQAEAPALSMVGPDAALKSTLIMFVATPA